MRSLSMLPFVLLVVVGFCSWDFRADAQKLAEESSTSPPPVEDPVSTDVLEISATGRSRASASTLAERRASAEAAGRAMAQVKLAETLGGLHITGAKTLRNQALEDEEFGLRLDEFLLQFAYEVGETSFETLSDGSMLATVRMRVSLTRSFRGILGATVATETRQNPPPQPAYATREDVEALKQIIQELSESYQTDIDGLGDRSQQFLKEFERRVAKKLDSLLEKREQLIENHPSTKQGEFTGLIVDGRGLDVKHSLTAKIHTQGGREIYGYSQVNEAIWKLHGMVKYAGSMEEAKDVYRKRLGASPLVVKAIAVRNRDGEVIVRNDDAVAIFAANLRRGFLQEGRVVFVVD